MTSLGIPDVTTVLEIVASPAPALVVQTANTSLTVVTPQSDLGSIEVTEVVSIVQVTSPPANDLSVSATLTEVVVLQAPGPQGPPGSGSGDLTLVDGGNF